MHLAQIMEEKTDLEKDQFGSVILSSQQIEQPDEMAQFKPKQAAGSLSDDQISFLLKHFLDETKDPKELLNQCVNRSRDRYNREYAKLNAFQQSSVFYTDQGVKERMQGHGGSLKYKMLVKERHPESGPDCKNLSLQDQALSMLILHNRGVDKVQKKYKKEFEDKKRAKDQGITYKELLEKDEKENNGPLSVADAKKKFKKKFGGAKGGNFDVVIKMKDEDGKIQDFDKNEISQEPEEIEKKEEPVKIEAENTLDMLEQALGGAPKKKKTAAKKKAVKKVALDT